MNDDLRWIQKQVGQFGKRDRGFRYPEPFRRRVVAYADKRLKEVSAIALERELDVPWATVRRWCREAREDQALAAQTSPEALVPVRLTSPPSATSPVNTGDLKATTPKGWTIEGLDVDQLCQLIERLS